MKHQEIQRRLARAVLTLHALPNDSKTRPAGYISGWPEMIRNAKAGAILHRDTPKFFPDQKDITDCYLIIDALYHLTEQQRQLLWARANHIKWRYLETLFSKSRTHLYRLYQFALRDIAQKLSQPS